MKIYTRTGDKGQTSLSGSERVGKNSGIINLIGTLDELNSFVGVLISSLPAKHPQKPFLEEIQSTNFQMGADIANSKSSDKQGSYEVSVLQLEQQMDLLDKELESLKNFILPGGSGSAAMSHVCRCVARRCERVFFAAAENTRLDDSIGRYINRLSDYFFVLARFLNQESGVDDILWRNSSIS